MYACLLVYDHENYDLLVFSLERQNCILIISQKPSEKYTTFIFTPKSEKGHFGEFSTLLSQDVCFCLIHPTPLCISHSFPYSSPYTLILNFTFI